MEFPLLFLVRIRRVVRQSGLTDLPGFPAAVPPPAGPDGYSIEGLARVQLKLASLHHPQLPKLFWREL